MKVMSCGLVVPGCEAELKAMTEEELLKLVAVHAEHAHGVHEVTPELLALVKASIVTK